MDTREPPFPVVGIGASAGGVQALEQFFSSLPADAGLAFIIVMHLSPDRKSLLSEILARHTDLPVEVAQDGQRVEKDKIYVMPPKTIMTMHDGRLRLQEMDTAHCNWTPIDIFLSSLARDRGEQAVAVILSGSGADGVLGIKAIKEAGGVTLAQASDSSGPGFASMPESAIATGLVDFAIPVDAMGTKLVEQLRGWEKLESDSERADDQSFSEARDVIYSILRSQTGHDFSGYKTRTFMRRLHRRMQIQQCETVADYVKRLRERPGEVTLLFRDLLINVTSFFRDPEAFETIRTKAIPRLFEGKGAADAVRIWVPGCSTGEEVYSFAILLREYMELLPVAPRVTIFATDIDEQALASARAGRYPESLMDDVSPERRHKFFTVDSGIYFVTKSIRDLCVFSPHNILRDPPFSRMDLISCRNLLIYLGGEAQRHVLPLFHYALRPGGFLFLGMSETIGRSTELFSPIDKRHCLFQALDTGRPPRAPFFANGLHPAPFAVRGPAGGIVRSESQLRQAVETRVVEKFAPPYVVVNEEGDIVYSSPRTGKYLELPPGPPTRHLLTMARKDLRLDLRSALRESVETRQTAVRENVRFETEKNRFELINVTVDPILGQAESRPLFMVLFTERGATARPEAANAEVGPSNDTERLEAELRNTRERPQTTIEEYETALEELTSANEELVSLNEETQSTNEELESSKEELQSLNEELQALNHELYNKLEELDCANSDLTNLFVSTQIATVFLDRNLVIRNFTPAAAKLFNIIQSDAGRPLTDLATRLQYPEFHDDIRKVLETGKEIERRVHNDERGSPHYLARLTAYRDSAQAIDGVVATFIDVTSLAKSEQRLQRLHDDRLNAMKGMASGLAHEINQPLSATANYLKTVQRLLKMPPERRAANIEEMLGNASEQLVRAGRIITQLRDIISRGEPDKTFQSIHELIKEVCDSFAAEMAEAKVSVALRLDAKNDRVLMDKEQIRLVLKNLIRNAIEAMGQAAKRELAIATSDVENDEIRINVEDTGCGLSEDIKDKLFEPFTSGKPYGMGIGLSICQMIVEGHDATIWADSRPGCGAIFSFTLPVPKEDN